MTRQNGNGGGDNQVSTMEDDDDTEHGDGGDDTDDKANAYLVQEIKRYELEATRIGVATPYKALEAILLHVPLQITKAEDVLALFAFLRSIGR